MLDCGYELESEAIILEGELMALNEHLRVQKESWTGKRLTLSSYPFFTEEYPDAAAKKYIQKSESSARSLEKKIERKFQRGQKSFTQGRIMRFKRSHVIGTALMKEAEEEAAKALTMAKEYFEEQRIAKGEDGEFANIDEMSRMCLRCASLTD